MVNLSKTAAVHVKALALGPLDYTGFQPNEVQQVAQAITKINPYCKGLAWEGIAQHMMEHARASLPVGEASYVATRGWCVSGYWYTFGHGDDEREWRFKCTVEAYGVVNND